MPLSVPTSPGGLAAGPFDPVIDLSMTGCDRALPGAEVRRTLYVPVPGENVPTPETRFDLMHVILNGTMLHSIRSLPQEWTPYATLPMKSPPWVAFARLQVAVTFPHGNDEI